MTEKRKAGKWRVRADVTKLPRKALSRKRAVNYSSGLKNSNPKRRISPAAEFRRILAEIGGVSLGRTLEEEVGEGAGTVMLTIWSGRRKWVEAMHAPVALMFRVFVSSMNSTQEVSTPRRKTGT